MNGLSFSGFDFEIRFRNFSSPKPSQIVNPASVKPNKFGSVERAVSHHDLFSQNGIIPTDKRRDKWK